MKPSHFLDAARAADPGDEPLPQGAIPRPLPFTGCSVTDPSPSPPGEADLISEPRGLSATTQDGS